jgi:hypothetical protein
MYNLIIPVPKRSTPHANNHDLIANKSGMLGIFDTYHKMHVTKVRKKIVKYKTYVTKSILLYNVCASETLDD